MMTERLPVSEGDRSDVSERDGTMGALRTGAAGAMGGRGRMGIDGTGTGAGLSAAAVAFSVCMVVRICGFGWWRGSVGWGDSYIVTWLHGCIVTSWQRCGGTAGAPGNSPFYLILLSAF